MSVDKHTFGIFQLFNRLAFAHRADLRHRSDEGARPESSIQVRRLEPALLYVSDQIVPKADGIVSGSHGKNND